jgi:phenylacetate-coenzyme A ligase PaaK-like adenylate-forming protein
MLNGSLMNPDALKEAIASIEGIDEYQIVITAQREDDPSSPDLLQVRVAAQEAEQERVRMELTKALTVVASVSPSIEFVSSRNEIFDPGQQPKATRVVDRRPGGER